MSTRCNPPKSRSAQMSRKLKLARGNFCRVSACRQSRLRAEQSEPLRCSSRWRVTLIAHAAITLTWLTCPPVPSGCVIGRIACWTSSLRTDSASTPARRAATSGSARCRERRQATRVGTAWSRAWTRRQLTMLTPPGSTLRPVFRSSIVAGTTSSSKIRIDTHRCCCLQNNESSGWRLAARRETWCPNQSARTSRDRAAHLPLTCDDRGRPLGDRNRAWPKSRLVERAAAGWRHR